MKYARILAVAIVAFALATPAGAKTTKWAGGVTGNSSAKSGTAKSFVDPANWDNGVPEPGDTVVFDTSTDYNNQIFVGGQDGSTYTNEFFDIGSAGLTIDMKTSYVWMNVNFTGSGKIVRTGDGYFKPLCDSDFTGGAEIQDSIFMSWLKPLRFGTGSIEFARKTSSAHPKLQSGAWNASITNELAFTGIAGSYAGIDVGQQFTFYSDVSATHDLQINSKYGSVTFKKNMSAPGKTVTVNANRDGTETVNVTFNGMVDANIVKTGNKILYLNGSSPVATNTLTVSVGTCEIGASGFWGGTNIAVAAGATLSLKGAGNLSQSAHLAVAEGGTVTVASGVTAKVAALTVGDKAFPVGRYTASTLPGTVSGSGSLVVLGEPSGAFVWTGGAGNNLWSDVGNWEGGAVPGDGAVVYFPSAATIENATDVIIGANGLSLVLGGNVTLNHGFAGPGALRISGGTFVLVANVAFTHAGGTTLSGNVRFDQTKHHSFGTGVLTIDGMSGGSPFIRFVNWAQTITNDIVIVGAVTNRTYTHQGRTVRGSVVDFNAGYISGSVTGDDDVMFGTGYGSLHVRGNVTVPEGKTIRLQNAYVSEETPRFLEVTNTLTGNLSVEGVGLVRLTTSATCTGDVTVRDTATLQLTADANLAETAVVSVETGGMIDIDSGVKVRVAELWIGGVKQPSGRYSAANCSSITGSGVLYVGDKQGLMIIVS